MDKTKETLQSRKFWITIIISGLAVGMFYAGHIDIDRMIDIIRLAAGVYVGGLSVEDAAKKLLPILRALNEAR